MNLTPTNENLDNVLRILSFDADTSLRLDASIKQKYVRDLTVNLSLDKTNRPSYADLISNINNLDPLCEYVKAEFESERFQNTFGNVIKNLIRFPDGPQSWSTNPEVDLVTAVLNRGLISEETKSKYFKEVLEIYKSLPNNWILNDSIPTIYQLSKLLQISESTLEEPQVTEFVLDTLKKISNSIRPIKPEVAFQDGGLFQKLMGTLALMPKTAFKNEQYGKIINSCLGLLLEKLPNGISWKNVRDIELLAQSFNTATDTTVKPEIPLKSRIAFCASELSHYAILKYRTANIRSGLINDPDSMNLAIRMAYLKLISKGRWDLAYDFQSQKEYATSFVFSDKELNAARKAFLRGLVSEFNRTNHYPGKKDFWDTVVEHLVIIKNLSCSKNEQLVSKIIQKDLSFGDWRIIKLNLDLINAAPNGIFNQNYISRMLPSWQQGAATGLRYQLERCRVSMYYSDGIRFPYFNDFKKNVITPLEAFNELKSDKQIEQALSFCDESIKIVHAGFTKISVNDTGYTDLNTNACLSILIFCHELLDYYGVSQSAMQRLDLRKAFLKLALSNNPPKLSGDQINRFGITTEIFKNNVFSQAEKDFKTNAIWYAINTLEKGVAMQHLFGCDIWNEFIKGGELAKIKAHFSDDEKRLKLVLALKNSSSFREWLKKKSQLTD